MGFRNYSGFDKSSTSRIATTGNGKVHKKPKIESQENPKVLPPPENGFVYVAYGSYWVGPFFLTSQVINGVPSGMYVLATFDPNESWPMFEGME